MLTAIVTCSMLTLPSALLLGIELDDKLFLEVEVYVFSLGECYDLSNKICLVNLDPLGAGLCLECLSESLALLRLSEVLSYCDNVTGTNEDGRNVCLLTVDGEVTVKNQLTSFLVGCCKPIL